MPTPAARAKRNKVLAVIVVSLLVFIHMDSVRQEFKVCERSTPLRAVVFKNTKNAIKENKDNPEVADMFQANLDYLVSPEAVDDETGLVDCGEQYKYFGLINAG